MITSLLQEHLTKSGLKAIQITPLAGATNHVFLIHSEQGQFVAKIPKAELLGLINRENEYLANQLASQHQISLPFYYFDRCSGINISPYLLDSQALTKNLAQQEKNMAAIASLLKKVHSLPQKFLQNINIFEVIKSYKTKIQPQNLPKEWAQIINLDERLNQLQQQLVNFHIPLVPCHGDAILGNFLQTTGGKFYLIDWEYAGNNDACWDLATFAVEAEFNSTQDQLFLNYYFGAPSAEEFTRFTSYKILSDYLWMLWCIYISDFENAQRRWQRLQ